MGYDILDHAIGAATTGEIRDYGKNTRGDKTSIHVGTEITLIGIRLYPLPYTVDYAGFRQRIVRIMKVPVKGKELPELRIRYSPYLHLRPP